MNEERYYSPLMSDEAFWAVVAAEIVSETWDNEYRRPGYEAQDVRRANQTVAAGIVFG